MFLLGGFKVVSEIFHDSSEHRYFKSHLQLGFKVACPPSDIVLSIFTLFPPSKTFIMTSRLGFGANQSDFLFLMPACVCKGASKAEFSSSFGEPSTSLRYRLCLVLFAIATMNLRYRCLATRPHRGDISRLNLGCCDFVFSGKGWGPGRADDQVNFLWGTPS